MILRRDEAGETLAMEESSLIDSIALLGLMHVLVNLYSHPTRINFTKCE